MPYNTRSNSGKQESIAERVKRSTRVAAVEANRRIQEMNQPEQNENEEQVFTCVLNSNPRQTVVTHRYMLRSMRR